MKYFVLCVLCCLHQLFINPVAALGKPVHGIRLIQKHFFLGQSELLVGKDGIRLINKSGFKFGLVSKAPQWNVIVFQPNDKTFCAQKLEEFCDSGVMSDLLMGRSPRMPVPNFFRQSISHIDSQRIEQLTGHGSVIKYLPTANICKPQIESILYAVFKVPTNGGIPLAFISQHQANDFVSGMKQLSEADVKLETLSIKPVTFDEQMFDPPPGYKICHSMREVVAGGNARAQSKDVNELFKDR